MTTPLTRAQRKQQIDLILHAFNALPSLEIGWRDWKRELLDAFTASERQHRKGHPSAGISVSLGAKQQMVRWIAHYLTARETPSLTELLHIRHDVCLAAAVADHFSEQISESWAAEGIEAHAILETDYAALMHKE